MALSEAKDVTVATLTLQGQSLSLDVAEAITSLTLERTIDGAPTLTMEIEDPHHTILTSGLFAQRITCQIDGKGFELCAMNKRDQTQVIVFEDLAVAEMRKHKDPRKVAGGTMNRVQFARLLLAETPWIPLYVAPGVNEPVAEIDLARGIVASDTTDGAIDPNFLSSNASSSGTTALGPVQVAQAAAAAGFSGQDLIIAVAVAAAESGYVPTATHKNSNGSTDYGLWQINSVHKALLAANDYKDPLANARMAYSVFKGSGWKAWSTYNNGAYKKHMVAAQTAVNSVGTDNTTGLTSAKQNSANKAAANGTEEDTWECLKRIFAEVQWRVYVDWNSDNVASVYVGPDSAFLSQPIKTKLTEQSEGVDTINWNFDLGKATGTATIKGRSERWGTTPGTPIELVETGLPNPWLVSAVSTNFFSSTVNVDLKRPQPELPEPLPPATSGGVDDGYLGAVGLSDSDTSDTSGGGGSGEYQWPVSGSHNITTSFGAKSAGTGRPHQGIDIAVSVGTPVYAAKDGVVSFAGNSDPKGWGNMVDITHGGTMYQGSSLTTVPSSLTRYAHLSSFNCRSGLVVKKGQQIGLSGGQKGAAGSGDATGPHLHFEIRKGSNAVDPIPLLNSDPVATKPYTDPTRYSTSPGTVPNSTNKIPFIP